MPAAQGVVKWPTARPTLSALVDELEMPLPDAAVDRVLLVHALEMSQNATALLREVWRVLASGGQLLVRGAEPARSVGAHGHHAVRSRPALFAAADHPVCCARPGSRRWAGARRSMCRRSSAAGFCARRARGSAPARRCRRRSPACISSRPPSRSIARFRRAARSASWCRR